MTELYILLYVVCGLGLWLWFVWRDGVLTLEDLVHLPGVILGWPAVLLTGLIGLMFPGQPRVLWRRK